VFDFTGETNNSGYLSMMGKEGIFSPGHMEENPFKYSPHMQKEQETQMIHLNHTNLPISDNYLNMGQKRSTQTNFENPSYVMGRSSEV
jgi:hypothetical protein